MKVIFRKDKENGEILAFFPQQEVRWGNIGAYVHTGQHFEADYLYYMYSTVKATEEEYSSLYKELQAIYDNTLELRQRVSQRDLEKSWLRR